MAHFAVLDENNVVVRVEVISNQEITAYGQEVELLGQAFMTRLYGVGRYLQTSYTGSIRGKFASVGDLYDPNLDVFTPPA